VAATLGFVRKMEVGVVPRLCVVKVCFITEVAYNKSIFMQFQHVHHSLLLIMKILIAHWEMMEKLILETLVPSHVMMVMN